MLVAWQLEEASVAYLLVLSLSCISETLYDMDTVSAILNDFALWCATVRPAPALALSGSPDDDSRHTRAGTGGHSRQKA